MSAAFGNKHLNGCEQTGWVALRKLLLSSPADPFWRFLTCDCGNYLAESQDTLGDVQHSSSGELLEQISQTFELVDFARLVLWVILLLRAQS